MSYYIYQLLLLFPSYPSFDFLNYTGKCRERLSWNLWSILHRLFRYSNFFCFHWSNWKAWSIGFLGWKVHICCVIQSNLYFTFWSLIFGTVIWWMWRRWCLALHNFLVFLYKIFSVKIVWSKQSNNKHLFCMLNMRDFIWYSGRRFHSQWGVLAYFLISLRRML